MIGILQLMRPLQWVKNLFVFFPLFFSQKMLTGEGVAETFIAFISFSFISSSIYCLNDILDIKADKLHPIKKERPLASGKISKTQAYIALFALIAASAIIPWFLLVKAIALKLLGVIALYFIMNIAYCIKLKHIAIIDVFVIATGFVLRIIAGGVASDTWISQWIVLLTFLLALFLAFAKRRDDVIIFQNSGVKARKNITRYNLEFLGNAISIVTSMTMICYIMWSISEEVVERMGSEWLYITSVFVLLGILRYLQVTMVDTKSGSPTKVIYKDHFIHACIAGWLITFFIIIYL